MSENSEHSPDDTETETKATEDVPDDSSKSETKLMMDQTDAALLEDEEMPTYISVSSISRRDDSSEIANAKQPENVPMEEEERSPSPYHSDDQAASSVYVLSSGEETDHLPYNDEDDEDEYGDSDGKLIKEYMNFIIVAKLYSLLNAINDKVKAFYPSTTYQMNNS